MICRLANGSQCRQPVGALQCARGSSNIGVCGDRRSLPCDRTVREVKTRPSRRSLQRERTVREVKTRSSWFEKCGDRDEQRTAREPKTRPRPARPSDRCQRWLYQKQEQLRGVDSVSGGKAAGDFHYHCTIFIANA